MSEYNMFIFFSYITFDYICILCHKYCKMLQFLLILLMYMVNQMSHLRLLS